VHDKKRQARRSAWLDGHTLLSSGAAVGPLTKKCSVTAVKTSYELPLADGGSVSGIRDSGYLPVDYRAETPMLSEVSEISSFVDPDLNFYNDPEPFKETLFSSGNWGKAENGGAPSFSELTESLQIPELFILPSSMEGCIVDFPPSVVHSSSGLADNTYAGVYCASLLHLQSSIAFQSLLTSTTTP
jgi:hypothetical protein